MPPPDSDAPSGDLTIQEYLARVPDDREWGEAEARRYRHLTADERLAVLADLLRLTDELLAGRQPVADPGLPFWRHWSDPHVGRPG
jgi:hypothetical protein